MTSVEPDKKIWGYICAVVFGIVFSWATSIFGKNDKKKTEEKNENNEENL